MESRQVNQREPLAIAGIGCRLPGGVDDPDALWQLLCEGGSAIATVPADRWDVERYYHSDSSVPVTMHTKWGGFLDDIDHFDARFWGISPREALRMDPQQRWVLECAWEAIEDAGYAPSQLLRSATGVYIGAGSHDYANVQITSKEQIDVHTNLGSTLSIIANRVSFCLDLIGPSIAVDTACSSALVAINLACEALWSGEIEFALAGGVNALIAPDTSIGFSKAMMLSPTGQCFAFDARANGYVRSEGAGVLFLLPLSRALARGMRPYAVVRAVSTNQDGRTSSITVPSEPSQSLMLREAYRKAGIPPARVGYMEAHGTGTPVGDSIEATALGTVLAEGRAEDAPCLIGSVKTNIGHLETASGVAGVMKAALALREGFVPPSINFETPNPNIDFAGMRLRVATQMTPFPSAQGCMPVAAVNSFGFGGTNAHVVLEAAPEVPEPAAPCRKAERPLLLPVSGKDESALQAYARRYRQYLAAPAANLAEICYSAGTHKEHHEKRAVLLGTDVKEMRERLRLLAAGDQSAADVVRGTAQEAIDRVSFVFTGQGAQWWRMGQDLLAREPLFRQAIEAVEAELRPLAGWSLTEEMSRGEEASNYQRTSIAQPAIFALQVALAELWRSWGIEPSCVVGHSVGEVAAARVAGIYSLADAVKVIYHRSRLQERTGGAARPGAMYAVGLDEAEGRRLIGGLEDSIQVAVVNGPSSITLSGDAEPLERLAETLEAEGTFVRRLHIPHAFHSHQMDPIRDELIASLKDIEPRASRIPFVSTVTAEALAGEGLDAAYWWRNVREPVRFAAAFDTLIDRGERHFLEIGPHPALKQPMADCLQSRESDAYLFHSLKRETDETQEILTNLAQLHNLGATVDWRAVNQAAGRFCRLPAYPWQRERFWVESPANRDYRCAPRLHPLLGRRVVGTCPTFEFRLDLGLFPYLNDHHLWDSVVFPAAGFCEIALALAASLYPKEDYCLEAFEVEQALFAEESDAPSVRIEFFEADSSFHVYSSKERDPSRTWTLNAKGRLIKRTPHGFPKADLAGIRDRLQAGYGAADYYADFQATGYQFGESFQHIRNLWRGEGESLIEIETPPGLRAEFTDYRIHPAVLDACFQGLRAAQGAARSADPHDYFYLPAAIGRLRLLSEAVPERLWAHSRIEFDDGKALTASIMAYDDAGNPVVEVLDFKAEWAPQQDRRTDELENSFYRFGYEPRHLWGSRSEGPAKLAPIAQVLDRTAAAVPEVIERYDLISYRQNFYVKLEEAAEQAIVNALLDLGWAPRSGDVVSLEGLALELGVLESHRQLLEAQLSVLSDAGYLRRHPAGGWTVEKPLARMPLAESLDRLIDSAGPFASEAELQRLTATSLADVLSGEKDAVELLFPGGRAIEVLKRAYREGGDWPAVNALMHSAVESLVESLPPRRTLRVLEIGAGTASLTRAVLPALPDGRYEYSFTDISQAFSSEARELLEDNPSLRFQTFDIEGEPAAQGIGESRYDLILGSNVIHATENLEEVLLNLKQCLAPEGVLLFFELTQPRATLLNVFGLLPGWWRFRDRDLRAHSPLMPPETWEALLKRVGFIEPGTVTLPQVELQTLFVAQAPPKEDAAEESVPPPSETPAERIVILADATGTATGLREHLVTRGHPVAMVRPGEAFSSTSDDTFTVAPESPDDWDALLDALDGPAGAPARLIHCWTLDRAGADISASRDLVAAQATGVHSLRLLFQALARREATLRTTLVTRGRASVRGEALASLAATPLTGFCRVVNNEHPEWPVQMVDLDPQGGPNEADCLLEEITLADGEPEVAYRGDRRYVNRLHRLNLESLPRRTRVVAADGAEESFRLEIERPGALQDFFLAETPRQQPAAGEVEVAVKAGGINFRDLMKALGLYPGNPVDLHWLGDDVAGEVVRVGEGVDDVRVGDRVAGIAPYGFRRFVTLDQRLLFPVAPRLSFQQAATLPTVFATAYYALVHLARMREGERVLIHAGTGGVGSAAIQIARSLGLEIFASAGSAEKRRLLEEAGVHHLLDSRSLDFADEVRAITGGEGVDCVLNSLAGEFIPKGIGCLRPFGRFIEIGKVDIYNNAKIGLEPLKDNISFFVVDLAQLLLTKPGYMAEIWQELEPRFRDGTYEPLPLRVFPLSEAKDAFRHMSQGKHIGKNVLDFELPNPSVAANTQDGHLFHGEGTYLITGGAGGFGFEVARWMAEQGARHLALVSRSGPDARTREAIEGLRGDGVTLLDARADVTDYDALKTVIDGIKAGPAKLRGIIHGAMIIDDQEILALDQESFDKVLHPKMLGAWNLHQLTRALPLDFFVSFSSLASVIGGIRQSNYSAANAFLDALSEHRAALGLPASSINWGALAGAGVVQRSPKTVQYLEKLGLSMYELNESLAILRQFLARQVTTMAASVIDWRQLAAVSPLAAESPVYSLVAGSASDENSEMARSRILAARAEDRHRLIVEFLTQQIGSVFDADPSTIDVRAPLAHLGIDSLMAVELVNRVESELGVRMPMGSVLSGPSAWDLAASLVELVAEGDDARSSTGKQPLAPDEAAELAADAELDPEISPGADARANLRPAAVFLTGGTGFLGAFLIRDLLSATDADIYCLVQAADDAEARSNLASNLKRYGLWDETRAQRLHPIVGDVARERFGLSEEAYAGLAARIEVIYHCAAKLNFVLPYAALKAVNVEGTREILRFACQGEPKTLHHVSSISVWEAAAREGRSFNEADELSAPQDMVLGYSKSKWVAERLVMAAQKRGLPATIHRPSFLVGDSETGASNPNDFVSTLVANCLQIGACFDLEVILDASPVDYVSRAIVHLSRKEDSVGRVYHLQNPHTVSFGKVIEICVERLGVTVSQVPYKEWIAQIKAHATSPDNKMFALLPFFTETHSDEDLTFLELNTAEQRPLLDCRDTLTALEGSGIVCPSLEDQEVLGKIVDFVVQQQVAEALSGVQALPAGAS